MPREAHVLVVGNGLSLLAEDLVGAGWRDVCAIDYSDTCTQRMRERVSSAAAAEARVSYRTMDVTALQYEVRATAVCDDSIPSTRHREDGAPAKTHTPTHPHASSVAEPSTCCCQGVSRLSALSSVFTPQGTASS